MRIFAIFEESPFFMPEYVHRFLELRGHEVVGMTPSYTSKAYPEKAKQGRTFFSYARKHPFRFGLTTLFYFGFKTVYYALMNGLCNLLRLNSVHSVRGMGLSFGVQIIDTININSKDYLAKLKDLDIDIVVSTNGQIFKKELLSIPKLGSLNIHTSILPGYGGCYPPLYYLLNNEKHYGISCHVMHEDIDKGLVVSQRRFPIEEKDSVTSLYTKAYALAAETLDEGITNFVNGYGFPDIRDVTPSYYSFPTEDDFKKLFDSGRKFL